jgi:hypothetical protein
MTKEQEAFYWKIINQWKDDQRRYLIQVLRVQCPWLTEDEIKVKLRILGVME